MNDIEKIKERVRKLMAVAGDGAASDGEIENAMRHAAKLIDSHHLSEDDCKPTDAKPDAPIEFGRVQGTCRTKILSTWENLLADAICKLFGCVQRYRETGKTAPVRVNGIAETDGDGVRMGQVLYFYGPLIESTEARDLFAEWSRAIATMGVARWGGAFRGDGGMYCMGFANALNGRATDIDKSRSTIPAKPVPLLGCSTLGSLSPLTAITLTGRYEMLKDQGKKFLKESHGVELSNGARRAGYRSGDRGAFAEGKLHGSKAEFGRAAKRKLLA